MTNQLNWAAYIPPQVGVPSLMEAHPGCAKTAMWKAIAVMTGRHFMQTILDQCLPEDIGGLPQVNTFKTNDEALAKLLDARPVGVNEWEYEVAAKILMAEVAHALGRPSIWLFDELSNAPFAVQAAALELINDPPENCWIACAANPMESAANASGYAPPMINRICLVDYEFDLGGWLEAMGNDDGTTEDVPFTVGDFPVVSSEWRHYRPFWSTLLAQFGALHPELMHAYPNDIDDQGRPWASPRSWHKLIKCLAAGDSVGASESVQLAMANGLVGEKAALAFMEFVRMQRLPDPMVVLNDPYWQVPKSSPDALGIFRMVHNLVKTRIDGTEALPVKTEWWKKLFDFSRRVYPQRQEYGLMLDTYVQRLRPKGMELHVGDDPASEAIQALRVQQAEIVTAE